jgi:hypothetical protein
MAALQERNGSFRLLFWHHGKQHTFTIGQGGIPHEKWTGG